MLKHSYVLKGTEVTADDYAASLAEAAAAGMPEARKRDMVILTQPYFKNIASGVMDYYSLLSGGNKLDAIKDASSELEKLADDIYTESELANQLPATPEEIPADRAGIVNLLQLARQNPKMFQSWAPPVTDTDPETGKGEPLVDIPGFDINQVWRELYPAAPKQEKQVYDPNYKWDPTKEPKKETIEMPLVPAEDAAAAVAKVEEEKTQVPPAPQEAEPETSQRTPEEQAAEDADRAERDKQRAESEKNKLKASWNFKVSADEGAVLQSVRQQMVDSGYFSKAQREEAFTSKLDDVLKGWYDRINEAVRDAVGQKEYSKEMQMQKSQEQMDQTKRVRDMMADEAALAALSPETRKRIEEATQAQAAAQLSEEEKMSLRTQRREKAQETGGMPVPSIPGFEEFVRNLQYRFKLLLAEGSVDESSYHIIQDYAAAVVQAATNHPEIPWEKVAAEKINDFPELPALMEQLQMFAMFQDVEKEYKKMEKPPKGPYSKEAGLITKNQQFDSMKGMGPWELDKEAKAIKRRKVMVANAMFGFPPVPFAIGDTVGFSRGSALDSGVIVNITKTNYTLRTAAGDVLVDHENVFEPASTGLF